MKICPVSSKHDMADVLELFYTDRKYEEGILEDDDIVPYFDNSSGKGKT